MAENLESVSQEARSSLITAVGIVLGFALAFFGSWSIDDDPWERVDVIPGVLLSIGSGLLTYTLYRSLMPYHQTVKQYESVVRKFMWGIFVVFIGFIAAIVVDL